MAFTPGGALAASGRRAPAADAARRLFQARYGSAADGSAPHRATGGSPGRAPRCGPAHGPLGGGRRAGASRRGGAVCRPTAASLGQGTAGNTGFAVGSPASPGYLGRAQRLARGAASGQQSISLRLLAGTPAGGPATERRLGPSRPDRGVDPGPPSLLARGWPASVATG